MKKRGPAGDGRDRRPKIRPLAAFLLAAALIVTAVQVPGVAAKAVELGKDCSLTVRPYSDEAGFANDLPAEKVAIDLYQVADAVEVPGYDTYAYEVRAGFEALEDPQKEKNLQNLQDLTAGDWQNMAQQAAKIALGGQGLTPVVEGAQAGTEITNYNVGENGTLKPGLYLIVARQAADTSGTAGQEPAAGQASGDSGDAEGSANAGDTQEPAAVGDAETSGDVQTTESGGGAVIPAADEEEKVTTQIQTDRYIYTFEPQLISIPDKEADEAGDRSTANNPGEWLYNAVATLKPQQEERMGSLEIVKTLADQSLMTEEATFVFQVDAYNDADELVYSNVVGMTFTGAGEQRVTLADAIPVGSRVVVTEAYSGASYEISGDAQQVGEMAADDILSMAFTNTGNDRHTGGHGIVNSFTYSEENSWEWSADPEQAGTE